MPRKPRTPSPDTDLTQSEPAETIAAPEVLVEHTSAEPGSASMGAGAYATPPARFESFEAFYPYYLSEHSQPWTRRLHFIGTGIAILFIANALARGVVDEFGSLIWAAIFGYGFAWAAHYFVEKNQPATFTYPAWSLMGDFKMFWEVVTRKRDW
jgi:hypothetical protein